MKRLLPWIPVWLAGMILVVAPPAGGQSEEPVYAENGQQCNVVGTPGDDKLRGTEYDDVICGLGGKDRLHGGRARNDTLDGGPGKDIIDGSIGTDTCTGDVEDARDPINCEA